MYVMNDVTRDSRVLREAASLAGDGHEVTIVGTPLDPSEGPRDAPEPPAGVRVIRVAVPRIKPWWVTAVRMPWRLRHPAAVLLAPWILVRAAWVLLVNRLLGRPIVAGGIDYLGRWRGETLGWCRAAVAAAPAADCHHAHDMEALSAARAAARRDGGRYVYDSHEVYQGWGRILAQPWYVRRGIAAWERRMARGAAGVVTIGDGVAAELDRRLSTRRRIVVRNCPPAWTPDPDASGLLRTAAGIPDGVPIVLCHGGFSPNRGLEETALAMLEPGLEAAHLVFLGYRARFIEPILANPRLAGRVHHVPAVPPSDVVTWVSGADVDVMAIRPVDLNSRLSVPNKLFESIAAGVPVVSTDLPERRSIVLGNTDGPLGALCDPASPASIAAAIRSILEQSSESRAALRARILDAAHRRWNWASEVEGLLSLYRGIAARGSGG
jgi:glycosyltransferase involved in cell wall biosynthesis